MPPLLRHLALVFIVAGLLPQVSAAVVAIHVHLDHGAEHGHPVPVDSIIPALHGHAHWADTPDHRHPLTAPAYGGASHARGPFQLALPVGCGGACVSGARADVLAWDDRPASRRPTQGTPTVLRI